MATVDDFIHAVQQKLTDGEIEILVQALVGEDFHATDQRREPVQGVIARLIQSIYTTDRFAVFLQHLKALVGPARYRQLCRRLPGAARQGRPAKVHIPPPRYTLFAELALEDVAPAIACRADYATSDLGNDPSVPRYPGVQWITSWYRGRVTLQQYFIQGDIGVTDLAALHFERALDFARTEGVHPWPSGCAPQIPAFAPESTCPNDGIWLATYDHDAFTAPAAYTGQALDSAFIAAQLALCQLVYHEFTEAREHAEEALSSGAHYTEAYYVLAWFAINQKEWLGAVAYCDAAIAYAVPGSVQSLWARDLQNSIPVEQKGPVALPALPERSSQIVTPSFPVNMDLVDRRIAHYKIYAIRCTVAGHHVYYVGLALNAVDRIKQHLTQLQTTADFTIAADYKRTHTITWYILDIVEDLVTARSRESYFIGNLRATGHRVINIQNNTELSHTISGRLPDSLMRQFDRSVEKAGLDRSKAINIMALAFIAYAQAHNLLDDVPDLELPQGWDTTMTTLYTALASALAPGAPSAVDTKSPHTPSSSPM